MIQTSYFAKYKQPNGISIAFKQPDWFRGESFPSLYPPSWLVHEYKSGIRSQAQYAELYHRFILAKYEASEIVKQLDGKALLCWEKADTFCHRRIVAEWIESKTGIIAPEYRSVEEEMQEDEEQSIMW